MEPRQQDYVDVLRPYPEEKKPKRFRLVKLEERVAPSTGTLQTFKPGIVISPTALCRIKLHFSNYLCVT